MEISQVRQGEVSTIELMRDERESTFSLEAAVRSEATLFFNETTDVVLLRIDQSTWSVKGSDKKNHQSLMKLVERDYPRLCWVSGRYPKEGPAERVLIQTHEFRQRQTWPVDIEMGIDDKVVDDARKKRADLTTVTQIIGWLSEQMIIPPAVEAQWPRLLISGSPHAQNGQQNAFRIHGMLISVDVQRDEEDRLRVIRIVESRSARPNNELRPLFIVQGGFKFCDITVAGQFRGSVRTQLDQIVSDSGSYLSIWARYNQIERENIQRKAQQFGWLQYTSRQSTPNGWRFALRASSTVETSLQLLPENNRYLEVAAELPPELHNIERQSTDSDANNRTGRSRTWGGYYTRSDSAKRFIEIAHSYDIDEDVPPESGYIFIGLTGDRVSLRRREQAQAKIVSAQCPMPQLGLLLENKPVIERRRRSEKALSPAVRAAFGDPPTERQVKALEIALNTPDIALIQGPPGTGKTKTIAALQVRLAEIAGESEGISGRTLLTSYQHDAVENAADKTRVLGLPAIKVGGRRNRPEEESSIERWRREQAEAIQTDLLSYTIKPASKAYRTVHAWTVGYIQSPGTIEQTKTMLDEVWDVSGALIPQHLRDRLLEMRQAFAQRTTGATPETDRDEDRMIKAVRALRVEPIAFSDDGPANAYKAYARLHGAGVLEPDEEILLQRAADWDSEETPDFIDMLGPLQDALLDRLLPDERPDGSPAHHAEVEKLLHELCAMLHERVRKSADGVEAALVDYLDEIENDVEGVRTALENYTAVLASTCQQVMGNHMEAIKGEQVQFETVIVDEAARANPLDLCIPMALAERRIILVGDHRQLPHMLEPDIERELEHSISELTTKTLRESLFERLFNELKKREQTDGIKRTITLDTQFRMHPILGDFVSQTFYEDHGESFSSVRPAADFVHGLSGYGDAVAAWKNIPLERGEEKGGQSKRRTVEARWIAQEVARIANERTDLSIGVISFYQAQVRELLHEMSEVDLVERIDDQTLQIAPAFRVARNTEGKLVERLRVGTVDAFQGKEFDVVILSLTRSNRVLAKDEPSRRRKYGHLMLANRLCVAMSRQQRLLIIAGDESMLAGEEARQAIPGLVAFHQLCEGNHGIVL